ncbi:MAG: hypothetical protein ACRC50_14270 [Gaiella sp.]
MCLRECVALGLASDDSAALDPLWRLVGSDDGEPVADLDEVVYGQ